MKKFLLAPAAILLLAISAAAQTSTPAKPANPTRAAFDKLKSLAGEWEGTMSDGDKKLPATTSFRVVSGGSAILNVLGANTPHEMVTMFHPDNNDLLATHYCGAQNQPRFRMVTSTEDNAITFDFKDATNLPSPSAGHMVGVKITFVNANHHFEDWTFKDTTGKHTSRFEFKRKP